MNASNKTTTTTGTTAIVNQPALSKNMYKAKVSIDENGAKTIINNSDDTVKGNNANDIVKSTKKENTTMKTTTEIFKSARGIFNTAALTTNNNMLVNKNNNAWEGVTNHAETMIKLKTRMENPSRLAAIKACTTFASDIVTTNAGLQLLGTGATQTAPAILKFRNKGFSSNKNELMRDKALAENLAAQDKSFFDKAIAMPVSSTVNMMRTINSETTEIKVSDVFSGIKFPEGTIAEIIETAGKSSKYRIYLGGKGKVTITAPVLNFKTVGELANIFINAGYKEFAPFANIDKLKVALDTQGSHYSFNTGRIKSKTDTVINSHDDYTILDSETIYKNLIESAVKAAAKTGDSQNISSSFFVKKKEGDDNKALIRYNGDIPTISKMGALKFLSNFCTFYVGGQNFLQEILEDVTNAQWALKNEKLSPAGGTGENNVCYKFFLLDLEYITSNPFCLFKGNRQWNSWQDAQFASRTGVKALEDAIVGVYPRTQKWINKIFLNLTGMAINDNKELVKYDETNPTHKRVAHANLLDSGLSDSNSDEELRTVTVSKIMNEYGFAAHEILNKPSVNCKKNINVVLDSSKMNFTILRDSKATKVSRKFYGKNVFEIGNHADSAEHQIAVQTEEAAIKAYKNNTDTVLINKEDVLNVEDINKTMTIDELKETFTTMSTIDIKMSLPVLGSDNVICEWKEVIVKNVPAVFAPTTVHESKDSINAPGKPKVKDGKLEIACVKKFQKGIQTIQLELLSGLMNNKSSKKVLNENITAQKKYNQALIAAGINTPRGDWKEVSLEEQKGLKMRVERKNMEAYKATGIAMNVTPVGTEDKCDFIFNEAPNKAVARRLANVGHKVMKFVESPKGEEFLFENKSTNLLDINNPEHKSLIKNNYESWEILTYEQLIALRFHLEILTAPGAKLNTDMLAHKTAIVKFIAKKKLFATDKTHFTPAFPTSEVICENIPVEISGAIRAALVVESLGYNDANELAVMDFSDVVSTLFEAKANENKFIYVAESKANKYMKEEGILTEDGKAYAILKTDERRKIKLALKVLTESAVYHRTVVLSKSARKFLLKKEKSLWLTLMTANIDQNVVVLGTETFKKAVENKIAKDHGNGVYSIATKRAPEVGRGYVITKVICDPSVQEGVVFMNPATASLTMADTDGDMLRLCTPKWYLQSDIITKNYIDEKALYSTYDENVMDAKKKLAKTLKGMESVVPGTEYMDLDGFTHNEIRAFDYSEEDLLNIQLNFRIGLKLNESKTEGLTGKTVSFDTRLANYFISEILKTEEGSVEHAELVREFATVKTVFGAYFCQMPISAKNNTADDMKKLLGNYTKVVNGYFSTDINDKEDDTLDKIFGELSEDKKVITGGVFNTPVLAVLN